MRCRWLALGLWLACAGAQALDPARSFSHYVKDTWSIEQGLPQITALALAQDDEGYVWVATQAGLARFDGVRFVPFDPENTPALPGMLTQALLTDRAGTLWIGTYKGVARYAQRRFTAVPRAGGGAPLDVRDLQQTPSGDVLVATTEGVFRAGPEGLTALPEAPPGPAYALQETDGALWIGSDGGAWRLERGEARHWPLPAASQPATVNRLSDAQGRLWAGTSRGLHVLGEAGWETVPEALDGVGPVEALREDGDGNLWIAAHGQLLRLRDARVVERIPDSSPAAHRAVRSIFEDREGNLWLGSQWDGVARLWNGWTRRYSVPHGLEDPIVWSVARDPDGGLWVGGNDGLSRFDGERFTRVLDAEDLPHPNAYTLLAEPGTLWIGTRRGLVRLRDGQVEAPPEFAPLASLQINGLLRDRRGLLWIATLGGVFRYDGHALHRQHPAAGQEGPRARLLLERRNGALLVGTQNGLLEVDGDGLRALGGRRGLPADPDVTALHELPDGSLLLGTLGERLYHDDGRTWFEFGAEHGLPGNSPFFITHDGQGFVWVAGIRGVYRVPLADLMAVRAGRETQARGQMLLSERGDQRGSQKGFCCNGAGNAKGFIERDTLWLPTRGGVVALSSDLVRANDVVPTVTIERMRHGGAWHALRPGEALRLPLGARDVAFEFSVLSFQQPGSVGLRYRLQGYDRDWIALADLTRRDAVYTNLPPGDYRFEVQGANNSLRWNPVPARLEFRVPPRLHETVAFYVLLALGVAGAILALHRLQTRHLRRQQLALEQLVAQRTQDLAAANRQLHEMSHSDALTGLRNRRFLQSQLPADLSFYLREVRKPGNEGMVMMLAVVDIDHFKAINDRHGHRAGDRVLQQFARLLERQVRSGDYVVRWGGEEFLLVFRPMPMQEAAKIAERIRAAVAAHPFEIESGGPLRLTASMGFIEYPLFRETHQPPEWERMVELADLALYAVKSGGRDGWATFRATQPMPLEAVLEELRPGVETALARGRIQLVRSVRDA